MPRAADYVTEVRNETRRLWEAAHRLKALQTEFHALDYGNTLDIPQDGAHQGITKADVGAVVFDSTDALHAAIIATGHKTNLAKLL